ncbi:MAG: KOW domain-containing RNA-binding protein [Oscillospiraceae bacterium]|nr:KOW domain-containing RNA-binding protein [Oscillospiraceae bacterium]
MKNVIIGCEDTKELAKTTAKSRDGCEHSKPCFARGDVVRSIAGRDTGRLLVVIGVEGERVVVIDGKERIISRPKRKNLRHIVKTGKTLSEEMLRFNNPLRKALNRLRAEH